MLTCFEALLEVCVERGRCEGDDEVPPPELALVQTDLSSGRIAVLRGGGRPLRREDGRTYCNRTSHWNQRCSLISRGNKKGL